jgi:hypothetical protein
MTSELVVFLYYEVYKCRQYGVFFLAASDGNHYTSFVSYVYARMKKRKRSMLLLDLTMRVS